MSIKTMSAAFKKVQDFRDQMNAGRTRWIDKNLHSCVYVYENVTGYPCAIAYQGRAKKPTFHTRYSSPDKRAEHVRVWMASIAEYKSERKIRDVRTLEIGDVLRSSWGYDQTNIDYYKVVELIGKSMVDIVEIGQQRVETGSMQGNVVNYPRG